MLGNALDWHHPNTEQDIFCIPRIFEYFDKLNQPINLATIRNNAQGAYILHFNFFPQMYSAQPVDLDTAIPQCVKDGVRKGSIKLLWCYHENDFPDEENGLFDAISYTSDKHQLPVQNQHIYFNNYDLIDRKKNWELQHNKILPCCDFLFWDEMNLYTANLDIPKIQTNNSHKYINLNHIHKPHRAIVAAYLNKNFAGNISYHGKDYCDLISSWNDFIGDSFECDYVNFDDQKEFYAKVPIILDSNEQNLWWQNHNITDHVPSLNSFLHIVNETYYDTASGLTEKSLKPLLIGKPFIINGPMYSHKILQDLGYELYPFFDYGFDSIEDRSERMTLFIKNIENILSKSIDELNTLHKECLDIAQHNQQHFKKRAQYQIQQFAEYIK